MGLHQKITVSIVLAAGLTFGGTATADPAGSARHQPQEQLAINFADLDLNTDAGVATLYERLRHAAGHVCELATRGEVLARTETKAACFHDAMAASLSQIGNDRLAALYKGR